MNSKQNQTLGYDGVFEWLGREACLEVTRAIGENGGTLSRSLKRNGRKGKITWLN